MEKSIINSLKRLERLGSENSRLTQKAKDAANEIETRITSILPKHTPLPKNYVILNSNGTYLTKRCSENEPESIMNFFDGIETLGMPVYNGTRQTILDFAEDIANGLLDDFSDFLEKRNKKIEKAIVKLDEAK